jgi:SAM-dependent methyltransferase
MAQVGNPDAPAPARRYDTIGRGYARFRRPDPRIAAAIEEALGDAASIVSVGSGTGSYEPQHRRVVALDPSRTMVDQRPDDAAPVVEGVAEHLPFRDACVDAALVVLTTHHWQDHLAGLRELARVSERQVILTWDPEMFARFWLVADYLPEIAAHEARLATLDAVTDALDVMDVRPIPIPADCADGFCGAYWRRPATYLDADARRAISAFARCDPTDVARAMARLDADLASGRWSRRYRRLATIDTLDLGYRLVVGRGLAPPPPGPHPVRVIRREGGTDASCVTTERSSIHPRRG